MTGRLVLHSIFKTEYKSNLFFCAARYTSINIQALRFTSVLVGETLPQIFSIPKPAIIGKCEICAPTYIGLNVGNKNAYESLE
jgi:hypothetical protein